MSDRVAEDLETIIRALAGDELPDEDVVTRCDEVCHVECELEACNDGGLYRECRCCLACWLACPSQPRRR